MSAPGAWFGPGLRSRSRPMSPMRMPTTRPVSSSSACDAAKPANTSTPRDSARAARKGASCPSETMKLPRLCICGGLGRRVAPVFVKYQNSSRVAGTQISGGVSRQPGSIASSGPGSSAQPEIRCAPIVEAFSSRQTLRSGCNSFSRMAHARPAGPAPTITTSYSMTSRSVTALLPPRTAEVRARCRRSSQGRLRRPPSCARCG